MPVETGKSTDVESCREGLDLIVISENRSTEKIQGGFAERFSLLDLHLPEENLRERRKGSPSFGSSGRIYYVFGEQDGREYLEFHAYHRMGEDGSVSIFL
ncbi:MAG: hypothetical protein GXY82_08345 [Methanospirillum sp.]|nr:hypothetical protein [Methanospirillum sp.]